jgi:hypothetical protein
MKRTSIIALAAALIIQAAVAFAQDGEQARSSAEPSERSALQRARDKYWSAKKADAKSPEKAVEADRPAADGGPASAAQGEATTAQDGEFPYTPVQISFVPGLELPSGTYDTSLSAGAIGNISRDVSGAQGAGVFSIARRIHGAQGSGVFNMADEELRGVQGAGVFNIAGEVRGAQAAGVFNVAGDLRGIQAAGALNVADEVEGAQVGIFNFARRIDGVQIGLFNYVVEGIHSFGFAYEPQSSYAYAYWQSGSPFLYTKWSIGAPFREGGIVPGDAVLGFGLGSRHSLSELDIDAELSAECAVRSISFERGGDGKWCGREWRDDDECRRHPRVYPSARVEASLPVGRQWRIFGALKADVDIDALGERVPDGLAKGRSWRGRLWGEDFTVWPKWSLGVKL